MSHYLYFVRVDKENAETSKEARSDAMTTLENENFASEGGYFSASKADWFVIGGRWSRCLDNTTKEDEEVSKFLTKELKNYDLETLRINPHLLSDKKKEEVKKIAPDFFINCYSHYGYESDAQIITPELREKLKEYAECEYFDTVDCEEHFIKELPVEADGDWLVVIDYHN